MPERRFVACFKHYMFSSGLVFKHSPSIAGSCSDSGEGFAERMKSEKAARLWAQLAEDHSRG